MWFMFISVSFFSENLSFNNSKFELVSDKLFLLFMDLNFVLCIFLLDLYMGGCFYCL